MTWWRARRREPSQAVEDVRIEVGTSLAISHLTFLHPRTLVEVQDADGVAIARYSSDGALRTPLLVAEVAERERGAARYRVVERATAGAALLATVSDGRAELAVSGGTLLIRQIGSWEFSVDRPNGMPVATQRVTAFVHEHHGEDRRELAAQSHVEVRGEGVALGLLVAVLDANLLLKQE